MHGVMQPHAGNDMLLPTCNCAARHPHFAPPYATPHSRSCAQQQQNIMLACADMQLSKLPLHIHSHGSLSTAPSSLLNLPFLCTHMCARGLTAIPHTPSQSFATCYSPRCGASEASHTRPIRLAISRACLAVSITCATAGGTCSVVSC
jgi:hypothetical protein